MSASTTPASPKPTASRSPRRSCRAAAAWGHGTTAGEIEAAAMSSSAIPASGRRTTIAGLSRDSGASNLPDAGAAAATAAARTGPVGAARFARRPSIPRARLPVVGRRTRRETTGRAGLVIVTAAAGGGGETGCGTVRCRGAEDGSVAAGGGGGGGGGGAGGGGRGEPGWGSGFGAGAGSGAGAGVVPAVAWAPNVARASDLIWA